MLTCSSVWALEGKWRKMCWNVTLSTTNTHIYIDKQKSELNTKRGEFHLCSDLRGRWRSCNLPDHQWPGRGSSSWSSASPARKQASSHHGVWRLPCWWLPWHSCLRLAGMNSWQTIKVERTRSTLHWRGEESKNRIKQRRWTKVTTYSTLSYLSHYPNIS